MIDVAANLARCREQLARACARAGRDEADVTLVAVSKRIPLTRVAEACRAGQSVFGENRIQDAVPRQQQLDLMLRGIGWEGVAPRWHFIGTLQSNKARRSVGAFALIHGVDSLDLGLRLARCAVEAELRQPILVQVNITGETGKHGLDPDLARDVVLRLEREPGLELQGLMTMARAGAGAGELSRTFGALRCLRDDLAAQGGISLPHLSMGMSRDFETAVAEGATLIRIGSAVFGPRE